MSLERRYTFRHPVDIRMHIRYRKRRFYCARARNLSSDGMYLGVQSVTLPTGTLVELEVNFQGRDRLIPAVVVHHQGSGIGVMFRNSQTLLLRELTQLRSSTTPLLTEDSSEPDGMTRP